MPADPHRVKELFVAAVDLPDLRARQALLDRECENDSDLRKRVNVLLAAHDHPESELERPLGAPAATADHVSSTEDVGTIIARRYKLLESIGEGGMGEVWVADQLEPIRRRVALKLIKAGMDSRAVLARFEAERQALALMDHPNIAKVLDAGTTEEGRPYFVMELVKGTPITKFCDERKLTPRERLELFVPVCQAIQHAHQKGVIHRDIKPSNVLVELYDDRAVPKVIDFGVAKAVGQQLTEKTLYTGFGALVGTPAYMAPEQATFNALDVDTRADVYALGVLLYELLAGSTPFEPERLKQAALDEVLRLVREEEPPRPSARLSTSGAKATIAAVRQSDPARLTKTLRGELDWIVMKALEKDRTRRYETANGLARDVERYLRDETVEARPPSVGYKLRKLARRNRAAVLTAAAVAAALLVGTAAATWQAVRATRAEAAAEADRNAAVAAEAEAKKAATKAEAINRFLLTDMLGPDDTLGRNAKFQHVLDTAAARVGTAFPDQPDVEAAVRHAIGEGYINLGLFKEAEKELNQARDMRTKIYGSDHLETLSSLFQLARVYHRTGKRKESRDVARQVLEGRRRALGEEHQDTLEAMHRLAYHLTWARNDPQAFVEAEALVTRASEISRRTLGNDDQLTLWFITLQSAIYMHKRDWDKAVECDRLFLEGVKRTKGVEHRDMVIAMRNLSMTLQGQAWTKTRTEDMRPIEAEAEQLARDALKIAKKVLSDDHPNTLSAVNDLALLLFLRNRFDEAEKLTREALPIMRRELTPDNWHTLSAVYTLGNTLHAIGMMRTDDQRLREAEVLLSGLVDDCRRLGREIRPSLEMALFALAAVRHDRGDLKSAEELYREGITISSRSDELVTKFLFLQAQFHLSRILLAKHEYAEAEQILRDLSKTYSGRYSFHYRYFEIHSVLGAVLAGQKKDDAEAEQLLLKGYQGLKERQADIWPGHPTVLADALKRLVHFYDARGKADDAARWRKELAARKEAEKKR